MGGAHGRESRPPGEKPPGERFGPGARSVPFLRAGRGGGATGPGRCSPETPACAGPARGPRAGSVCAPHPVARSGLRRALYGSLPYAAPPRALSGASSGVRITSPLRFVVAPACPMLPRPAPDCPQRRAPRGARCLSPPRALSGVSSGARLAPACAPPSVLPPGSRGPAPRRPVPSPRASPGRGPGQECSRAGLAVPRRPGAPPPRPPALRMRDDAGQGVPPCLSSINPLPLVLFWAKCYATGNPERQQGGER